MDTLRFLRGKIRLRLVRVSDLPGRGGGGVGDVFQSAFGGLTRSISEYVVAGSSRFIGESDVAASGLPSPTFCLPMRSRGGESDDDDVYGGSSCVCRRRHDDDNDDDAGFRFGRPPRLRRRRRRRCCCRHAAHDEPIRTFVYGDESNFEVYCMMLG